MERSEEVEMKYTCPLCRAESLRVHMDDCGWICFLCGFYMKEEWRKQIGATIPGKTGELIRALPEDATNLIVEDEEWIPKGA